MKTSPWRRRPRRSGVRGPRAPCSCRRRAWRRARPGRGGRRAHRCGPAPPGRGSDRCRRRRGSRPHSSAMPARPVEHAGSEHGAHRPPPDAAPPACAPPGRRPAPPATVDGAARRARRGPRSVGARATSCRLPPPQASATGHSVGDAADRAGIGTRRSATDRRERRGSRMPAPEEALSAGNITFTGYEGAEVNAYQALPAGDGPFPGSWSSITCPAGTRRPRRSPGASPPRATTRCAPTSTPARGSMSTPTMPPRPPARPAASPTTSSWATPRPRWRPCGRCPPPTARSASSATARADGTRS